jgi:hypothetical protein
MRITSHSIETVTFLSLPLGNEERCPLFVAQPSYTTTTVLHLEYCTREPPETGEIMSPQGRSELRQFVVKLLQ